MRIVLIGMNFTVAFQKVFRLPLMERLHLIGIWVILIIERETQREGNGKDNERSHSSRR